MLHDRRRETSPRAENPPFVAPLLCHDSALCRRRRRARCAKLMLIDNCDDFKWFESGERVAPPGMK